MESLIISLNAVAPMFLLMALGYGLRGIRFFTDDALGQMNKLAFRVLIPMQLFRSAFQADLAQAVNIPFLLWTEGLVVATFLVMAWAVLRITPAPEKRGALLQGMFRGNIALIGMAVMEAIFGADQCGAMAVAVAITVPLYNVLAVVTLEVFQGGRLQLGRILREIVTNPLIIGCFSGLAANLLGLRLPAALMNPVAGMGAAATPVALIVLGASFHLERVSADRRFIIIGVATKLVLLPLAAVSIGVALGFRGAELGTMAIIFAAPTAVSSFAMAQQMGADGDLAASMVVFTGMLSCLTIFLWVFALLGLGLI